MKCSECGAVRPAVKPPELSPRLLQVLRLLDEGLDAPQVAARLFIGLNTVYQYTKRLRSYFGVHTTWEAVQKAKTWDVI